MQGTIIEGIKFSLRAISYLIKLYLSILIFKVLYGGEPTKGQISMGSSNGKYSDENVSTLFQYLQDQRERVFYIMDPHSTDWERVESIGKVYPRFSVRANLTVFRSEVIIYDTSYVDLIRCPLRYVRHIKRINIFHGIHGLKSIDESNAKNRLRNDRYIIASSSHEKRIKMGWGFPPDRIFVTGLPRFDVLYREKEKNSLDNTIFYMPTWRPWFRKGFLPPSEDEVEIFRNSDFYKNILQLAQSAELNNYLKTKGYYLEIYLHKLMHRYMRRIKSEAELSNITFLSEKTDVQYQILKSKLLITDYSSVFFDFLFLDKPVIFYQFDYEKYYQHIPGSYISKEEIKTMRVASYSELFSKIKERLDHNDFALEDDSKKLVNKYIAYYDDQNCNRVYDMIKEVTANH